LFVDLNSIINFSIPTGDGLTSVALEAGKLDLETAKKRLEELGA
jgi:hypothetical protein